MRPPGRHHRLLPPLLLHPHILLLFAAALPAAGLHLVLDPDLLPLPRRAPRYPAKPWTPMTFPFIGSASCASDYHQRPTRDFLCDPDQMLGHASARRFADRLQPFWDFCPPLPRRRRPEQRFWPRRTNSYASEPDFPDPGPDSARKWKLGMGVARVLAVAPRPMNCLPIPPNWQYSSVASLSPSLSTPLLLDTARTIRERWSIHADCRIDALLLLAQQTWLCNETWHPGGLSLSLALSRPLALFLNSSGTISGVWRAQAKAKETHQEWQLIQLALRALEEAQDAHADAAEADRVARKPPPTPQHSVPIWAWIVASASASLSLACAYCGHSINSSGRLAFLIRSGPTHQRRGNWGAGFGGGMLEMRGGGGGGGGGQTGSRRGLMGGMMSKPRKSMADGGMGGGRF